ncbi:hypothetical protein BT69DRAFT_1297291 [Atractiella rhizophila]|nr:hypothetical protein BT69DRAFT_1297291 [Atractiella rhizophila]
MSTSEVSGEREDDVPKFPPPRRRHNPLSKSKCDGVRPICGACHRTAISQGKNPKELNCTYVDPKPSGAPKKRLSRRAQEELRIGTLERRIDHLESRLREMQDIMRIVVPSAALQPIERAQPLTPSYLESLEGFNATPDPSTATSPVTSTTSSMSTTTSAQERGNQDIDAILRDYATTLQMAELPQSGDAPSNHEERRLEET